MRIPVVLPLLLLIACQRAVDPDAATTTACPAPVTDTAGWSVVERDAFSFRLPPAFESVDAQGIDSDVALFRTADGRSEISFDLGWYSNDLRNDPSVYVSYDACAAEVGGHPALIVTGRLQRPDSMGVRRYFAAAAWRDIDHARGANEQPLHLTLWTETQDSSRLAPLNAVLRTVRFER